MMERRERCADPGAPCHLLRHDRLNVSLALDASNAALRRTQDAIHGLVRVSGLPELGRVLERLRGCAVPRAERTLDLIAHANSDGVLVFGTSLLAPGESELEAFAAEKADALAALGFTRVRLIGCYTAGDKRARGTLAHVGARLRVKVYGCSEFVDESLFDVDGFSPKWESLLVPA